MYPPRVIDDEMFSCEHAVHTAYDMAQVSHQDIQFFGLYDCFPICLIRAIEAVGLASKGKGGEYIERMYNLSESQHGVLTPEQFPINTHGGLLAFGAPWEVFWVMIIYWCTIIISNSCLCRYLLCII